MCGGVHYGEVKGLVSVERFSCNRGASCLVEGLAVPGAAWRPAVALSGLCAPLLSVGSASSSQFKPKPPQLQRVLLAGSLLICIPPIRGQQRWDACNLGLARADIPTQ